MTFLAREADADPEVEVIGRPRGTVLDQQHQNRGS